MTATDIRLGVIPAAGAGIRAYPRTIFRPKVLLEVGGRPLLQRNLEILRDALGITDVVVIVGHLADQVRDFLGDGGRFGVKIRCVDVGDPEHGLASGLYRARDLLTEPFVTILGDELYLGCNHAELFPPPEPWEAACAVVETDEPHRIKKNYSLSIDNGRVMRL